MNKAKHGKHRAADLAELQSLDVLFASHRFGEARLACERLLTKYPDNPALLHKLGTALIRLKEFDDAKATLKKAVALAPQDARIRNDLGIAHEKDDDLAAAETCYREALARAPNLAEAHSNLADLLIKLVRPDEAIAHAREAVRLTPSNPLCWQALGDALQMHGETQEAIGCFEKAVLLPPPNGKSYAELARAYLAQDRKDEAIAVLQKARLLFGDDPRILNDLGLALGSLKRFKEAQELFETAYRRLNEPTTLFNVLVNLRFMQKDAEMFALADEVLKHPQPNVALTPIFGQAAATCEWQLQERLLPHFLEWCALDNDMLTTAGQNLLWILPTPSVAPAAIRDIAEKVADTHRRQIRHYRLGISHARAHAARSKLRVGYLSSDFRQHAVNYFISGLLSHYDKQHFEVFCYSNLAERDEDDITAQYKKAVDGFVRVTEMDDTALARRIADDGIHILIDLSGYTAGMRMNVMYHRPAPVQATYVGYPFTTGIREIDYALADPCLNTPENAANFVEDILEIPASYYSCSGFPVVPDAGVAPPVTRNGYVTFGSLNNCYKLNRPTVAAWSRILARVPAARMILNNPRYSSPRTQENVLKEFEQHGIPRQRITIITGGHPQGSHLHWYEDIDIALDAFPQTGGTTSFEATWMGVPLITLAGEVLYQRLSYSILKNCGTEVEDLIAFDVDAYVDRAVALANDPARIAELHATLPANLRQSILGDPARHTRFFEEALIEGWNRKLPERPMFAAADFVYSTLDTPAAPLVATVQDPGNLYRYVVEEQGRWFAPEYALLGRLAAASDGLAVEVGGEPGFFSLELAHTGMRALCLSTSTVAGRLVRAAAGKSGIADRVEVRFQSARTNLLDRAELENVALLRIGVEANDGEAGPVANNPRFWAKNAPLVLLSVHCDGHIDLSTAGRLVGMGYAPYRQLPGLGCFVPCRLEETPDPYMLYLLLCPPERKATLLAAGLLVDAPQAIPAEGIAGLSSLSQKTDDPWRQMDEWVLHCARRGLDPALDVAARWGYLELGLQSQTTLMAAAPSTTRRMTLIRLLSALGRRDEAVSHLNQCIADMEQGAAQVTMPFLGPSPTWDEIPASDRLAEWLFAALVETRCRLAAHSTYFLADKDTAILSALSSIGFETSFSKGSQRARSARGDR